MSQLHSLEVYQLTNISNHAHTTDTAIVAGYYPTHTQHNKQHQTFSGCTCCAAVTAGGASCSCNKSWSSSSCRWSAKSWRVAWSLRSGSASCDRFSRMMMMMMMYLMMSCGKQDVCGTPMMPCGRMMVWRADDGRCPCGRIIFRGCNNYYTQSQLPIKQPNKQDQHTRCSLLLLLLPVPLPPAAAVAVLAIALLTTFVCRAAVPGGGALLHRSVQDQIHAIDQAAQVATAGGRARSQ